MARVYWLFAWWLGCITWQAKAEIVLQPHQQYAVKHLMDHPEQKGMLIFHSLGSGKTYLALAYTEQFPDSEVIILLPRFLQSNWQIQMKSFGVKNPSRYRFVPMQTAYEELKDKDLSRSILVIDEVHKLVENIRYSRPAIGEKYGELYFILQKAKKILTLTGTPIFTQASDIAYLGNLITGKNEFDFNPEKFKQKYMQIRPVTSLLRGHFLESKWVMAWVPFFSIVTVSIAAATALPPLAVGAVALAGSVTVPFVNEMVPAHTVPFREFKPELLKEFASEYVSFYETQEEALSQYPEKEIEEVAEHYTPEQVNFFLNFVDEDLNPEELNVLLADSGDRYSPGYVKLNSHEIQRGFLHNPVAGREIGNLSIRRADGSLSEPSKFQAILKKLRTLPGQAAVYSNYDKNGIRQFAAFLDRHGFEGQYVLLDPNDSVEKQIADLDAFNTQKKRIILIHPEITEGVSLKATEQFHVLEPVANIALLAQIIGRVVRFQSHMALPAERRKVKIFLWESTIQYSILKFPTEAGLIRQHHWQKRYAEINPSMWTKGIIELDPNYFLKEEAPDTRVKRMQNGVARDMEGFHKLVSQYSIEKPMKKPDA